MTNEANQIPNGGWRKIETIKRFLFWGLCILLGGMSIFLLYIEKAYPNYEKSQEQAYQHMRNKGWTVYTLGKKSTCFAYSNYIVSDKQGKIWVTSGCKWDGIQVFDGEHWLNHQLIWDIEGNIVVDSKGRVGIDIDGSPENALAIYDGKDWSAHYPAGDAYGEISEVGLAKLGADEQEYIWVEFSYVSEIKQDEEFVLRKNDWMKCGDEGSELSDHQCVVTLRKPQNIYTDLHEYVDDWDRIWSWTWNWEDPNDEVEVSHSEGSHWLTISSENSGLDSEVLGLVVDNTQRLWILEKSQVVKMIPLDELELVPQEIVDQRNATLKWREATTGYYWFIPVILGIILLAKFLNIVPGVLLALGVGVSLTLLFGRTPIISIYAGNVINPSLVVMFFGVIGALIGGQIDKSRDKKNYKHRMSLTLAIIGLITGAVFGYGFFVLLSIATSP